MHFVITWKQTHFGIIAPVENGANYLNFYSEMWKIY